MHCYQWQDLLTYLPTSITPTLVYVKLGKNVAYL